jgi:glycosyltransferase involved in cell wall biosynthesis
MRRIDVALDRRLTSHMSVGMKAYTRAMLARLPFAAPDLAFATFGAGDNFDAAEQLAMPLELARMRPRLAHIMGPYAPVAMPCRYVVTIHDLIDLHFPEFVKKKVGPYYRYVVGPLVRRAARVITDDERTVDDLVRFLDVDRARVRVVPLGVDETFGPTEPPLVRARAYVLNVGNHRPHKNLATLAAAWSGLPDDLPCDLVFTGHDDVPELRRTYGRTNGEIAFLGDVDEAGLRAAYAGAAVYAHPAELEGYGLPMLEAMHCGAFVVASANALPRVLHGHAATLPSRDVAAWTQVLAEVLRDPTHRSGDAARAREAVRDQTWDRVAALTAAVYRELL